LGHAAPGRSNTLKNSEREALFSGFPSSCQDSHGRGGALGSCNGNRASETGLFGHASPAVFTGLNTDPGGENRLGYRAGWWGMEGQQPQPQVRYYLFDDLGLVNEGNDAHRTPAMSVPSSAIPSTRGEKSRYRQHRIPFSGCRMRYCSSGEVRSWACHPRLFFYLMRGHSV